MAKAQNKTTETAASVEDFINSVADESVRNDCKIIAEMMGKATDSEAKMWGANIVGFGNTVLKYDSGRELDWMLIGFSPRKANISLYGLGLNEAFLADLGKYKTGKGCLYINKLSDVNKDVLIKIIENAVSKKREK